MVNCKLTFGRQVWPDSGKKRGYGYIEFDDEDAVSSILFDCSILFEFGRLSPEILTTKHFQVDKIVLVGIHIIGNCRLEARKGLSKEQQEAIR